MEAMQEGGMPPMALVSRKESDLQLLVAMMPIDVWKLVLDRIEDEDDLQAIANSSPVFRELLSKRMTTFLFDKVWKVMEPRSDFLIQVSPEVRKRNSKTCGDCGRIRRKGCHEFSAVLSLRQVCKRWRECVDDYFVEEAVSRNVYKWTSGLTKSSTAAACVQHFAKTHQSEPSSNPFVGRSLELVLQVNEERPQVLQMLSVYGVHVLDCLIRSNDDDDIDSEFILQLGEWLKRMPNLQRLKLVFNHWLGFDNAELNNLFAESSLPRLNDIKRIEFCEVPEALVNHVIQINSHVTSLYLAGIDQVGMVDVEAFSNLELEVFQFECEDEEQLAFLETIRPSYSVKVLELVFHESGNVSWERIFRVLEQKWSLCQLDLDLTLPVIDQPRDEMNLMNSVELYRLNLRNVRKLYLHIDNLVSLDFLLPMKDCLVSLTLEINYFATNMETLELADRLVNSQIIKLVDYQYRLRESNVWDIFPSLKKIKFSLQFSRRRNNWEWDYDRIPNWLRQSIPEEVTCTRSNYIQYLKTRNN